MTGRQRRDAILHAATRLMWPVGDWEGTDCGLAVVSAVTGLELPRLRNLAAGLGLPTCRLGTGEVSAVLAAVGVAARVVVPQFTANRVWRDWMSVRWYPAATTLVAVNHPRGDHWVAVRGHLVADALERLMPTRDYWGRRDTTGAPRPPDKCAELIQLGGVDTGHGLVPPLCVARLVRRDVGHSQVVVRGAYERAASLPPLRVEVRAAVGPDRLVFPPCVDCGGPVALSVEALPTCRDCRSLFDWGRGNGCTRP